MEERGAGTRAPHRRAWRSSPRRVSDRPRDRHPPPRAPRRLGGSPPRRALKCERKGNSLNQNKWLAKCVLGGKMGRKYDVLDEAKAGGGGNGCCVIS